MNELMDRLADAQIGNDNQEAAKLLSEIIQDEKMVGETLIIDYDKVVVQVHDERRQHVGGIPNMSFLLAARFKPKQPIDWKIEEASILLLRVVGSASLPGDPQRAEIRAEAARRVAGTHGLWDSSDIMDGYTYNELAFAGIECRVVGTFYLAMNTANELPRLELRFGSDLSNFYPNKCLKVFKPTSSALERIVNFRDPEMLKTDHSLHEHKVNVGRVRYASTDRAAQGIGDVPFYIAPTDLLSQKTALFGMTRTGKSNTTKIIAKSVFELRFLDELEGRVGQLIFDYNGEYANENIQDAATREAEPTALKNVWCLNAKGTKADVVTYGVSAHPQDPDRRIMKINAHGLDPKDWSNQEEVEKAIHTLVVGKQILGDLLQLDRSSAKYLANFLDTDMSVPDHISDKSIGTRYRRRVLAYRALLHKAGLAIPAQVPPVTKGLFNDDLLKAMENSSDKDYSNNYRAAAGMLRNPKNWAQIANSMEHLERFVERKESGYSDFNENYVRTSSTGEDWADSSLKRILGMFQYPNGPRLVARLAAYHEAGSTADFSDAIYDDVCSGKLVIIDQSSGEPALIKAAADRIMWRIFRGNQRMFTDGKLPVEILVYIEEAHNLLPSGKEEDYENVWVRTAKEGAKYHIGLVYATQEVSSIQKNILKNTANWFVAHLNNTDETRELRKFYDFEDFERSILRAPNKGFIRAKTLSSSFIVPIQVEKFSLPMAKR